MPQFALVVNQNLDKYLIKEKNYNNNNLQRFDMTFGKMSF